MKKGLLLFILFFSFFGNSQELLLHYKFDNNIEDSSRNNYTGIPSGVTFVEDRNGNQNSAVSFDGIDDFINFPNISNLKPSLPVSFSLWVKFDDLSPQNSVVFTTDFEEDNHSGVFMTISTSGKLAINYGDARGNTISSNRRSKLANTNISPGIWYHVTAIVKSATDMEIFIGCENAGGTYSGSGNGLGYTNNPGNLGKKDSNTSGPPYYFKGSLDDFKYYKGVITNPASEESTFNNLESSLCKGTDYNLPTTSSNGILGIWTPAFNSLNTGTTTYTFTPNTEECASTFTHSIEIIDDIQPNFTNLETLLCKNAFYNLPETSTNGISGNWSPVFDSSIIGSTSYTFTPDSDQCGTTFTHSIEVVDETVTSFTNLETSLCEGTSYNLPTTSLNGIVGNWLPVFDNSVIGITNYTFTPNSDQCGTSFTHSIEITNETIPTFSNLEAALCLGTEYNLPTTSTNGITGNWLPAFDSSVIGTTNYIFTPNSSDCVSNFAHSIEITNEIQPIFTNLESSLCQGVTYNLPETSTNGITGNWSPIFNSTTIGTTLYTFISDSGQCSTNMTHVIEITNEITPSFSDLKTVLCEGESYSLPTTSLNGIIGNWLPVFDNSIVGETVYTFIPTSSSCATTFNHSIKIQSQKTPNFINLETTLCEGTLYSLPTISANGVAGSWFPEFNNIELGTTIYTFTPDLEMCVTEFSHSIEITQKETPVFGSLPNVIFENENYNLPTISDNGITGNWSPSFDNTLIGNTTYTFNPINVDCENSFTHIIIISSELIIPLFFTPNNDTKNDFWKILGLESYNEVEILIFDRYGKLLAKPDINIGWDGKYDTKNMPSNDYWYSLSGLNSSNELVIRKGHFSLLRK